MVSQQRYLSVPLRPIVGGLGIEDFYGKSSLEDARLYTHTEFVEVETRRIPEILDNLGWCRVDLLKMDIEGMERNVLADGRDWLARVGLILLEVHSNTSPEELSSLLHPYGWTLQQLEFHDEETYLGIPGPKGQQYSNSPVTPE